MFCVPRRVISTNNRSITRLRRTYTSMRLERFEESADMVVVARNNDILKKLVLEAKKEYEKDAVHRVHIFMADTCVSTVFAEPSQPSPHDIVIERTVAGAGTGRARSAQ